MALAVSPLVTVPIVIVGFITVVSPLPPDAPVSPLLPLGIPKFKVYTLLFSDMVTVALLPAASVVTVPTLNVGVIPSAPLAPS